MILLKNIAAYKENLLRLESILAWAGTHLSSGDVIAVSLSPTLKRQYVVSEHGAERLSTWPSSEVSTPPSLAICNSRGLPACIDMPTFDPLAWTALFRSRAIEVWRLKESVSGVFPYDLTEKERQLLMGAARKASLHFLHTGKTIPASALVPEESRLHSARVYVDVAYWLGGDLRASTIVEDAPCVEAVSRAAIRALHDSRFKPVSLEEFGAVRIELTFWNGPFIPLLPSEIAADDIYFEKLYVAVSGSRRGWYLPEVFNCVRFDGLLPMLDFLARQKGGFARAEASFYVAEVIDSIESDEPGGAVLPVRSSMVMEQQKQRARACDLSEVRAAAGQAAAWLSSLQEKDGWMPISIDPSRLRNRHAASWPRLAHTAWALAEFARVPGSEEYATIAHRLFTYCSGILDTLLLAKKDRTLAFAYLSKAAQTLGLVAEAGRLRGMVATLCAGDLPFEPIPYLQAASCLWTDPLFAPLANRLFKTAQTAFFEQSARGDGISLAAYAELLALAREQNDAQESDIGSWYRAQQHEDGSFPNTTHSHFAYTRGTGKVFEVMACLPELYEKELSGSFAWLRRMQYGADNTYFMSQADSARVAGALRHDMNNAEVCVDSAGHFILGSARLLAGAPKGGTLPHVV